MAATATLALPRIFDECQRGVAVHPKNARLVAAAYAPMTAGQREQLRADFVALLQRVLLVFRREPAAERLVEFIARCAAALETCVEASAPSADAAPAELGFASRLLEHLMQFTGASDKAVRFRSCQLVSKILDALGDEAELEDELCGLIHSRMLDRTRDRVPLIRMQAVHALARLQDPADVECPVIARYILLLNTDSSSDVRRAVLGHVALSKLTLPEILRRTRDVKDAVRRQAFRVLAEKVHIKAMSIGDRVQLLDQGLQDRSEPVRAACSDMLCKSWLPSEDAGLLGLLDRLDVEHNMRVCEMAVRHALARASPTTDKPYVRADFATDHLTPESALLWRVVCQHYAALGDGGALLLDGAAPEVSELCELVSRYTALGQPADAEAALRYRCITGELLKLADSLDLSDEAGRRALFALTRDLLGRPSTDADHVALLWALVARMHPGDADRVRIAGEVCSDVRERSDPTAAWHRCLDIVSAMLETVRSAALARHGALGELVSTLILPGIQQPDPVIRNAAVRCLGLCCLLGDVEFARKQLLLLLQVVQVDVEDTAMTALKALFDLMCLYGIEVFSVSTAADATGAAVAGAEPTEPDADQPPSADPAHRCTPIAVLQRYLDHESAEMRATAAEGFARLLYTNRLASAHILTRLILLLHNPTTQDEPRLLQCLAVSLPAYALASREHQDRVAEVFVPVMRTLANAPPSSPLAAVNSIAVAQYLADLTSTAGLVAAGTAPAIVTSSAHDDIGLALCNAILSEAPDSKLGRTLCRALAMLSVSLDNSTIVAQLQALIAQIRAVTHDRLAIRALERFGAALATPAPAAAAGSDADDGQNSASDAECADEDGDEGDAGAA